ncbi:MAG: transcriptional repressor [Eubacteriaceae bacterium]|nr:transcriptional repressor [Eubacteriaceae bacterium]
MKIHELEKRMKEAGFKLTNQRLSLLSVLDKFSETMVTAEELLTECQKDYPATNITTVYRNLILLEGLRLLHKTSDSKGKSLYKLVCSDEHHHHMVCLDCGKVESFDFCPLEELRKITERNNFRLVEHNLELYGVCSECDKKINEE